MAALTPIAQSVAGAPENFRYSLGNMSVVAFRVSATSGADDFVSADNVGLSWIEAVLGVNPVSGVAGVASTPVLRKNATSNGATEGSTPGALAIETSATLTYEIVLLGKV